MNRTLLQAVGERIRKARVHAGVSNEELASTLGWHTPTEISAMESGNFDIGIDVLTEIAAHLNTSAVALLGGELPSPEFPNYAIAEVGMDLGVLTWNGVDTVAPENKGQPPPSLNDMARLGWVVDRTLWNIVGESITVLLLVKMPS